MHSTTPLEFLLPSLFFLLLLILISFVFLIFLFLFRHDLVKKRTAYPCGFVCLEFEIDPIC